MANRELSNLTEFNLVGARNVNILIGVRHRDAMDFRNSQGEPVHIDEHYIIYRITNSIREKGFFGSVPKEMKLSVQDFTDIFGSEVEFMEKWAFCPVILDIDTNGSDNKVVLYGCEVTHRYDIKK